MITAVSASSGRRSSLLSRVVLPLPKKPVSTVTGMRCSAAFWVEFCVSLMSVPLLGVPEPPGFPELLPRLLEPVAPALFARGRLLGQFAQRPAHVFRGPGRNGDVGHHLAGYRAIRSEEHTSELQ